MKSLKNDKFFDKIIKYIVSSDLNELSSLISGEVQVIPQFPLCGQWRKNVSFLHIAASYGSITCIQFFIPKININIQTEDLWTPLHCASANLHLNCVEYLLKHEADPNINNSEKMTPLHLAALNGSSDIIFSLVNSGADPNALSLKGWNAIHYAATSFISSVIDPLVIAGACIDQKDIFLHLFIMLCIYLHKEISFFLFIKLPFILLLKMELQSLLKH